MDREQLREAALKYHSQPTPGKIEVVPTKPLVTQADLSLGYTPGVAEVCLAIKDDPAQANTLTIKPNLVAVITNGTAVLGLGNIGPLAAKPVMEGKAVLFKKFAGIDGLVIKGKSAKPVYLWIKDGEFELRDAAGKYAPDVLLDLDYWALIPL